MKQTLLIVCIHLILLQSITTHAQITVSSTTGYIVDINVRPIAVLPASLSCIWGYNYNVKLSYQIFISGPNKPSSLYTLQGTLGCGSSASFFDLPNNGGAGITTTANAWRSTGDCNVITPSSLACNIVNVQVEGPGISSRTVSYPITYTPLPVTLEEFEATEADGQVKLNWITASEFNCDHFVVQRSVKPNEWNDLVKIKAVQNSTVRRRYGYIDSLPVEGTAYYRLKEVDKSGNFSFSNAAFIRLQPATAGINVYPVPNRKNKIFLRGTRQFKDVEMIVTDVNGLKIYSTFALAAEMELPQLKPGMYLIRFVNRMTGAGTVQRYLKV